MLKHKLILVAVLAYLLSPSHGFSQGREIADYKVKAGDTLWSIAAKELGDPFLWPKIWKENSEIKNPDKLQPGMHIKIPLYLVQREKKEESDRTSEAKPVAPVEVSKVKPAPTKAPARIKIMPLVNKAVLASGGYISDSVAIEGSVIGSPSERNLFGNNDLIYIQTAAPAQIGDKFYIVRIEKTIIHPVTAKKVGKIVEIRGVAEIVKMEYGDTTAKITEIYGDIVTGDLLDKYYEINPPLVAPPYRKPDIDGIILAGRNLKILSNNYDLVYIDRGLKNGLEVGDLIGTIAAGKHKIPNGTIQVIDCREDYSTAIVLKNTGPIQAGNLLTKLE